MPSQQIQLALWVFTPVLQAAIAVTLYRRKLHRKFPAFFAYFPAQIVSFAIGFPLRQGSWLYFDVYYATAVLWVIFAFKIIHEVFSDIFRPYPALKDLGTALFKWAAMIMILVSAVMVSMSPGWDEPIMRTILVVQRSVDVIQCGMVIFLLAFAKAWECHGSGRPSESCWDLECAQASNCWWSLCFQDSTCTALPRVSSV